ncbi:MAG: hypothetical protein HON51_13200 [Gammaproteobacteria bacterium]|nr:hypothetical protein [Gammaproteobacteria bacterium]MBT5222216.1 hypothetical protein [Gammaproteobacteria bacterium]MBT5826590.1 hypothetical protein [Gammaproteobacteria bacterium]MBT5966833.1 hypothetical protein [Gammaproteobacteria bacterium]MBT6420058.1 hypothetical protein [Gammaproteobacteria bacterium]
MKTNNNPTSIYTTKSSTSKFDQSWSAVIGALSDQGVRITTQDRGTGIMQGTRYGIEVTFLVMEDNALLNSYRADDAPVSASCAEQK